MGLGETLANCVSFIFPVSWNLREKINCQIFLVISILIFCALCWWFAKKILVNFFGGTGHEPKMEFWFWSFDFGGLDLGVLLLGVWILEFWFWILEFWFWGFGSWSFAFGGLDLGVLILDLGVLILDLGVLILGGRIGVLILYSGSWILGVWIWFCFYDPPNY